MTPDVKNLLRQFAGWLSADISELHHVEVPVLAESLERFLTKVEECPMTEQAQLPPIPPVSAGHSPLPWRFVSSPHWIAVQSGAHVVASWRSTEQANSAQAWADAALIVEAVNHHAECPLPALTAFDDSAWRKGKVEGS